MNPEKLNPQIKEFQIGKKDLRKVTIYPLSYFDEKQLISVIVNAYIEFIKRAEKSKKNVKGNTSVDEENIAFATYVLDLIEKNILEILQLARNRSRSGGSPSGPAPRLRGTRRRRRGSA